MGVDDLAGAVDFTLAFAVVHEMPAAGPSLRRLKARLTLEERLSMRRSLAALEQTCAAGCSQ